MSPWHVPCREGPFHVTEEDAELGGGSAHHPLSRRQAWLAAPGSPSLLTAGWEGGTGPAVAPAGGGDGPSVSHTWLGAWQEWCTPVRPERAGHRPSIPAQNRASARPREAMLPASSGLASCTQRSPGPLGKPVAAPRGGARLWVTSRRLCPLTARTCPAPVGGKLAWRRKTCSDSGCAVEEGKGPAHQPWPHAQPPASCPPHFLLSCHHFKKWNRTCHLLFKNCCSPCLGLLYKNKTQPK